MQLKKKRVEKIAIYRYRRIYTGKKNKNKKSSLCSRLLSRILLLYVWTIESRGVFTEGKCTKNYLGAGFRQKTQIYIIL